MSLWKAFSLRLRQQTRFIFSTQWSIDVHDTRDWVLDRTEWYKIICPGDLPVCFCAVFLWAQQTSLLVDKLTISFRFAFSLKENHASKVVRKQKRSVKEQLFENTNTKSVSKSKAFKFVFWFELKVWDSVWRRRLFENKNTKSVSWSNVFTLFPVFYFCSTESLRFSVKETTFRKQNTKSVSWSNVFTLFSVFLFVPLEVWDSV